MCIYICSHAHMFTLWNAIKFELNLSILPWQLFLSFFLLFIFFFNWNLAEYRFNHFPKVSRFWSCNIWLQQIEKPASAWRTRCKWYLRLEDFGDEWNLTIYELWWPKLSVPCALAFCCSFLTLIFPGRDTLKNGCFNM